MRVALLGVVGLAAVGHFVGCGSSRSPGIEGTGGNGTGGNGTGGSAASGTGGSSAASSDGGIPDVVFGYDAPVEDGGVTQDSACAATSVEAELAPLDMRDARPFRKHGSGLQRSARAWRRRPAATRPRKPGSAVWSISPPRTSSPGAR